MDMTSKELIDHTKRLIAIPSTRDNPEALRAALEYVETLVRKCPGLTIEHFERDGMPSFLAYRGKNRPQKFDIILNGHVDVVPGKPDQFLARVKNGRLYGRGALDMKGTAVTMTDVFCSMVNKVSYNLGLQIVCDEEIGGYNGTRLQIDQGLRSEFVIIGEYSNHRRTIYNAARGICWAEFAFSGKEAHGAHSWHGDNAVVKAGNFAAALLKRFPTPDHETWTSTASIASLTTPNDTYNKVPDSAILKVDFRFTQEDPAFHSKESIKTLMAGIDPEAKLVNLATYEPAIKVEELNPYSQGMSAAVSRVTKESPQFLARPGSSDGRHYALFNTDVIEFGLFGDHSHSDDEYVELESFAEYQAILCEFLRKPIPKVLKQKPVEQLHNVLLEKLVGFPTVSRNYSANNNALAYIEEYLQKCGMHVTEFERNGFRSLVAVSQPDQKQPTVLLQAHLDVVPAPEELFKLRRRGDKLYGRGVMDMKFAIASYMAITDDLKDDLSSYDFGIMITTDEEVGSENGTIPLLNEHGYKPKVVIIPDSGEDWRLETFAKGAHWIKLTATGKSGHASRQWEGESAIRKLLNAIREIELLIPADATREDTTLSIGTIDGGTTANQIPSNASAMLDVRYGNMADYEELFPKIQKICKKHAISSTIEAVGRPCINDPNNPYIKPFSDIVTKVTGTQHPHSMSYAATDGRHFSELGVPCIVIEPPSGDRHKNTEWLSQSGFDQFTVILEQYVRQMAAVAALKPAKERDIAQLTKHLSSDEQSSAYVWYASFGFGLSKENFMTFIEGGKLEGTERICTGCRDKSPPKKDMFISLPYDLVFADQSPVNSGGFAILNTKKSARSHTIARAYLITVDQFEDIAAQENYQTEYLRLPLTKSIRTGHTTINNVKGSRTYDELMYCGEFDRIPMFTLTTLRQITSYTAPNPLYTKSLCKGLSQNPEINADMAVEYLANRPGIIGNYTKEDITDLFNDASES
jgi:succinyl-diaminopimelate desuccinylase